MYRVARRLAALSFEALIALFAILSAIAQLSGTTPESVISQATAEPWPTIWAVSYLLSGLVIIGGIAAGSIAAEGAGVIWLAGAIAVQLVAIVTVSGWAVLPLLPTFLGSFAACLARVWILLRGLDVVTVERQAE